jgi:ABC-2 type transport system permease protein
MKSLAAYLYFAKMKFMTSFIYRFEFIASVLSSILIIFSTVFMWKTVYHAVKSVDGSTESQMITYAILAALLGMVFNVNVEKALYERMLQGDIAVDFIRPTNIILCYLAEDIGMVMGSLLNRFVPMFIFISIFFYKPAPANPVAVLLFVVSSILSFGILWLIDAIVGVSHMKLFDIGTFVFVKDAIVVLLSGSIIPIWFLPEKIRVVLSFLPFQYIYQTPLGIYIGKYSLYDAAVSMLIQAVWIGLLLITLNTIWENVRKNLMVQGG